MAWSKTPWAAWNGLGFGLKSADLLLRGNQVLQQRYQLLWPDI